MSSVPFLINWCSGDTCDPCAFQLVSDYSPSGGTVAYDLGTGVMRIAIPFRIQTNPGSYQVNYPAGYNLFGLEGNHLYQVKYNGTVIFACTITVHQPAGSPIWYITNNFADFVDIRGVRFGFGTLLDASDSSVVTSPATNVWYVLSSIVPNQQVTFYYLDRGDGQPDQNIFFMTGWIFDGIDPTTDAVIETVIDASGVLTLAALQVQYL